MVVVLVVEVVVLVVVEVVVVEVVDVVDVVELLVVVVVVDKGINDKYMSVVQSPSEIILIVVVSSGTNTDVKPINSFVLLTFSSNGITYPSVSENRLKGPVLVPADIN